MRNLLTQLPVTRDTEVSETLLKARGLRLERIVSFGQASPDGFWYDQVASEWVLLLAGRARLLIEGEPAERDLRAGCVVHLPAHCRHRVTWTDPDQATIWLAVFFDGDATFIDQ